MKKTMNKKCSIDWLQVWSEPAVIDGQTVKEQELAEYLDWQLATGQKDFKLFRHLKKTGFLSGNPVTAAMLSEAAEKLAARK